MASKQRISYVPLDKMTPEMRAEMERCARMGTPRPESSAVRAHVPGAFWAFANSWRDIFHSGVCDHAVKELARLYITQRRYAEAERELERVVEEPAPSDLPFWTLSDLPRARAMLAGLPPSRAPESP